MALITESILDTYLHAYRDLIAIEEVEGSTVLSLPMHLAAGHRIEITVTKWSDGTFILSDSARTLGEIEAAGFALTRQMRERLDRLATEFGANFIDRHLILNSKHGELGGSIQRFLEVSKTIGDMYLVHKHPAKPDEEIVSQVRAILDSKKIYYRLDDKIPGQIENHPFDFVVPPNGHPGLALGVVGGKNTHSMAPNWYYKCDDVRNGEWYKKAKARLALVYDARLQWSVASREILEKKADIAIASDRLGDLRARL